jgi:hypothetical protein
VFAEAVAHDLGCPTNRPHDRRLRFLTVRFPEGPMDKDELRNVKCAWKTFHRALADQYGLAAHAGCFAYSMGRHRTELVPDLDSDSERPIERTVVGRQGWHLHVVLDCNRIPQHELDAIVARQAGVSDAKIQTLRLPGELIWESRIHRLADFASDDARGALVGVTVSHFDYIAGAQELHAPKGCTLWTETGQPDKYPAFRAGRSARYDDLLSVPVRCRRFRPLAGFWMPRELDARNRRGARPDISAAQLNALLPMPRAHPGSRRSGLWSPCPNGAAGRPRIPVP